MTKTSIAIPAGCLVVILAIVLGAGIAALLGWILSLVLAGFGLTVGFWPCAGAVFLLFALLSFFRGKK